MEKTENTPEAIEETQDNENVRQLGQLLQSYRDKVGMDIDQAADALCLTTGTLEALENEDFHLLPEAPYIRGYLRGYAKLADVSSAEAIALYESLRGGSSIPDYKFTPSKSEDYTSAPGILSSSVMKIGGAIVLLLLLVVLSMIPGVKNWATDIWTEFSKETIAEENTGSESDSTKLAENDEETDSANNESSAIAVEVEAKEDEEETSEDSEKEENTLADQTTGDSETQSTNEIESTEVQEAASLEGVIERQADTSAATATDDEKTELNANEEVSETEKETDTTDETTLVQTETDSEQNEAAESATQANEEETTDENAESATTAVDMSEVNTEAGEVAIKLVFEDEVWMRIKKGDGKQVFEGLRKPGEVHELKSVKPLNFKVGNALGVKIYINGQLYDQKPHQRGVVSRFDIE